MSVTLKISPRVSSDAFNALFAETWPRHNPVADVNALLARALFYVCAFDDGKLIGFAKVIGDGGVHGFLLDPTVSPAKQRQGIGKRLVEACADEGRRKGVEWLHVDFEPQLKEFYRRCGFLPTNAGLMNLRS